MDMGDSLDEMRSERVALITGTLTFPARALTFVGQYADKAVVQRLYTAHPFDFPWADVAALRYLGSH